MVAEAWVCQEDVQFLPLLPPWPPESSPASVPWPLSSTVAEEVARDEEDVTVVRGDDVVASSESRP